MLNPMGTVHGGVAAPFLDSVASCAIRSALAPGASYSTAQLDIQYTRPIRADAGPITGVGHVVHIGPLPRHCDRADHR